MVWILSCQTTTQYSRCLCHGPGHSVDLMLYKLPRLRSVAAPSAGYCIGYTGIDCSIPVIQIGRSIHLWMGTLTVSITIALCNFQRGRWVLCAWVSAHQMLKPFLLEDAFPASESSLGLHKPVIKLSDFQWILVQLLAQELLLKFLKVPCPLVITVHKTQYGRL